MMNTRDLAKIAILALMLLAKPLDGATPLSLGTTYRGTLSVPGQSHSFQFAGAPGQLLYFDSQDNNGLSMNATISSPEGAALYYGNDDYDYGPFVLTEMGNYTLVIDGGGATTGNYQFRLLDLPAAPVMTLGTPLTGQINPPLACNVYRFNGTAGQRINLQTISYSSSQIQWKLVSPVNTTVALGQIYENLGTNTLPLNGNYYLLVSGNAPGITPLQFQVQLSVVPEPAAVAAGFGMVQTGVVNANQTNSFAYMAPAGLPIFFDSQDTSGQSLVVDLIDPSSNFVFTVNEVFDAGPYVLPRSGNYTLKVRGAGGASGNFRFRLLDLSAVQTLSLNSVVSNVLSNPYQTEVYQFAGTAGQRLFYDAIDDDFDNVSFWLRNPDGQAPISGNSDNDRGPGTLPYTGTYYLFLQSALSSGNPNYAFKMLDVASQPVLPLNTDFGGALAPNASTIYRLAGTNGQQLFFDGKLVSAGGAYWTLHGPNDVFLNQVGLASDFEVTLANSGNYVLVLSGSSSAVSYTNRVNTFNYTTNTLTLGTAVTNTIVNPGNQLFYTFTGTAGQRVYYDALNADFLSTYATLVSPHGAGVFSVDASYDRGPVTLTESGPYTLVFDGQSDATGVLRFQLLNVGTQPALPLNADLTGTLAANASVIYRLAGTNGEQLYFDSKWVNAGGAYWTLYGPNDAYVNQAALSGDFEVTLGIGGNYVIVISAGTGEVSYTNQVNAFNYTTNSLTLGTGVTNTIVKPGNAIFYTFTGTAGQRVYYDALDANFLSMSVALIAPHGAGIYAGNASYDRGPITLPESGTYTLVFDGAGDTTGGFSFQVLDIGVQPTLPLNADFTGVLAPNASVAYRLAGATGQRLYFNGKGVNAGGAYWTLYGPNDAYVNQASLGSDFELTLPSSGNYVVVMSAGAGAVSYTNQVNAFNYTTNALTLGSAVTNAIVSPGDVTFYTFAGTAGQRLYYDALNTNFISMYVTLIGPHGAIPFSVNASYDLGPMTLNASGPYTLVLDPTGDSTESISFNLLDLASVPSTSVGATITDSLSSLAQTKLYRFNGTMGQRVNLQSVGASGNQAYWQLLGPADQILGPAPNITGNIGTVTLPGAGSYVVAVIGYGATATPLNYQLSLTDGSDAPAAASGFGALRSGNIGANQTNSFTYTAPVGLPVFYDSQDASGQSLVVDLIDPFGNAIFTVNEISDSGPYVLPRSGNYTLKVRGSAGAGGNFRFRLLDLSASPVAALNNVVSNTLSSAYQTDVYQFTSSPGQRLFYDAVVTDPDYPSVSVASLDPRGQFVSPSGAFVNDYGPFTRQYGGTYYLFVGNNRDTARSFAFRLLDVGTQLVLSLNVAVTNALQSYPAQVYQYAGTAGQRLYFRGNGSNPSGYWTLFDPNNNTVSGGSSSLNGDFEVTLPVSGSYTLLLGTYNGNSGTNVIQVNDYLYFTNSYVLGAVVSDAINRPGEQKYYTFTGTLGQRLVYDPLTNDLNHPTAYATLINPQGQHVEGPATPFINDIGPFTLQQSGAYTLVIDGNGSRTGPFAFRLLDLAAQPALPLNLTVTNALQSYPALLNQYSGTAGQRLYFRGNGNNPNGFWVLYDPNNAPVSGGSSSLYGDFEVTLPMTGTYALMLATYNGSSGTNVFQVNDYLYFTNSYVVGTAVSDAINRPGEQKYYTFVGTVGQRLFYDAVTNDLNYPLAFATLLNPQGQHVEGPAGAFVDDFGPFTLWQSGTYTLVIDGNAARTGPFAFRLLDLAVQPALPLSVAVTNTLQNYPALMYQYAGTTGQRLYFRGNGSNPSGYWTLFDPNNNTVSGGSAGLSGDFEVRLPIDGTYALLLGTYNGNSGANVFQVNPFNFGEVFSINRAPVLSAIADQDIGEGENLSFTAAATDADSNSLTFSLDSGAPVGATIGAGTGAFNWTPPFTGFSYVINVTVRVTDNGSPALSAAQTLGIKVISGPIIIRAIKTATNVTVLWRSAPGERYRLQYRNNLSAAVWTDVNGIDITATNFVCSDLDNAFGTNNQRYYRVLYFPAF